MAIQEQRDTFLTLKEIVEQFERQCEQAEEFMRKQQEKVSAPYDELLKKIASHQAEISNCLKAFRQDSPVSVLETEIQFKESDKPSFNNSSPGSAIQYVNDVNKNIVSQLKDQALKTVPDSTRDRVKMLSDKINTINKQISMDRVTVRDI